MIIFLVHFKTLYRRNGMYIINIFTSKNFIGRLLKKKKTRIDLKKLLNTVKLVKLVFFKKYLHKYQILYASLVSYVTNQCTSLTSVASVAFLLRARQSSNTHVEF